MEFVCSIYGGYFGARDRHSAARLHGACGQGTTCGTQRAAQLPSSAFINGIATLIFVVMGVVDRTVALIVMAGSGS